MSERVTINVAGSPKIIAKIFGGSDIFAITYLLTLLNTENSDAPSGGGARKRQYLDPFGWRGMLPLP